MDGAPDPRSVGRRPPRPGPAGPGRADDDPAEPAWERPGRGRGLAAGVIGLLIVVAAAVVSRGVGVTADRTDGEVAIERSTEALRPTPAEPAAGRRRLAVVVPLDWGAVSTPPIAPVRGAPVVALDRQRVAVAGARDGELAVAVTTPGTVGTTAPTERAWDLLPGSGLSVRAEPLLATTDDGRLLVWGGREGSDGVGTEPVMDGAVYDETTGRWQPIPPPPVELGAASSAAVVRDRLVVVGTDATSVTTPTPSPEDAAPPVAFEWRDGAWSALPSPPVRTFLGVRAAAVGPRVAVVGVVGGDGSLRQDVAVLSFDPQLGSWRTYDVMPLRAAHEAVAVALDTTRLLLWGRSSTADLDPRPDGVVVDLETGAWRQLSRAPAATDRGTATVAAAPVGLAAAVTSDGEVVIAGDPFSDLLVYSSQLGEWAAVASPQTGSSVGGLAFAGGRLVWWGEAGVGEEPRLWVLPGRPGPGGRP